MELSMKQSLSGKRVAHTRNGKAKRPRASRAHAVSTRAEEGESLEEYLLHATSDEKLRRVMLALAEGALLS